MLKTPKFWNTKPPTWQSLALSPIAKLYACAANLHKSSKTPQKTDIPVICIGNITLGGAGKTPSAIAVLKLLKETGKFKNPHFLTRGYKGSNEKPLLVTKSHTAKTVGDEPLILAEHAPTIVAKNRYEGALLAMKNGADLIIMDDGLQNYDLAHDIKIAVIDGKTGLGNEKIFPAGPLRQSTQTLQDMDAIFITNSAQKPNRPKIFYGDYKTDFTPDLAKTYTAFCGLARPDKFFDMLENMGVNLTQKIPYPDHHAYTEKDMDYLKSLNTALLTTQKDAVKLPDDFPCETIKINMVFENEDSLQTLLLEKLGQKK